MVVTVGTRLWPHQHEPLEATVRPQMPCFVAAVQSHLDHHADFDEMRPGTGLVVVSLDVVLCVPVCPPVAGSSMMDARNRAGLSLVVAFQLSMKLPVA